MENNKYVKLHSLLRMFAALLVIAVFISMFVSKMVFDETGEAGRAYVFPGAFFGEDATLTKGNVLGFVGYILVLLGGLAGLAFVFIDEMIGKDLTKTLSFVAGGLIVFGGLAILLFSPLFKDINGLSNDYYTGAAPIVFGILAVVAGACNVAAPILEDKGY